MRVINPWNSLPDYIKESKSYSRTVNDEHVKNVENIHWEKNPVQNRFLITKNGI